MKAVTWHGTHDVRVDNVDDPTIEHPTDAIVRITSTGICGSDLHLYEVLGAFIDPGDILGHEPMGIVEEVGAEVSHIKPGDRVVIPFNISCGHCYTCEKGLQSQCETTQVREYGTGAALLGYTKLYGQVPGGQAEFLRVPQAHYGPIKVPEGPPDDRFVYLSDVLPDRLAGGRVRRPPAGRDAAGARPRPDRRDVHANRPAPRRRPGDRRRPRAGAARPGRGARRRRAQRRRGRRSAGGRARADRRPRPDLGDRRRRDGGARLADRQAGPAARRAAARRRRAAGDPEGRDRPAGRAPHGDRARPARRHDLAVRRLRRRDQPDAADPDVRQADQRCAWARRTSGAGSTTSCRCSAATTTRSASTTYATHRVPIDEAPHAYEIFQKKQDGAFKILLQP